MAINLLLDLEKLQAPTGELAPSESPPPLERTGPINLLEQLAQPPDPVVEHIGAIPAGAQSALGFGPKPAQPPGQQFPVAREVTRAAQELPEFGSGGILSGEDRLKVAALSPVFLATTDPKEIADILTSNFENIGISQDPGGNLIAANNKTGVQVIINRPGISKLDILQGLGIVAAFTPAAGAAAIPARLGARVAAGAAGSGLTQAAIEGIQSAVGGELNEEEIAIAGALGGVAETVIPAIQSLRQSRQSVQTQEAVRAFGDVQAATTGAGIITKETGIPLFQAQKTLIPAELEKQAFLSQLPASTIKASDELKLQNQAAGDAVNEFLGQLAPPSALVTGAERFRTAAQRAVEKAKNIRKEKTSPLFNNAFAEGGIVDLKPVNNTIKSILVDFPKGGEVERSLSRVLKLLRGEKPKKVDPGKIIGLSGERLIPERIIKTPPSLKLLHGAKLEIDQMINKVGTDSLGNTTKAKLVQIKKTLLSQMDKSSKLYQQARKAFELASPPVTKLQESIIGKVANLDDTQLRTISQKIFNAGDIDPSLIPKARNIIDDVDPDAWGEILRVELERRIGDTSKLVGDLPLETAVDNIPGQLFSAIFGSGRARAKQTKVLFSGLDNGQRANLKFLELGLRRASLGRAAGSQTAAREEIKRELRGGIFLSMGDFFLAPLRTMLKTGQESAFNRRTRALADVMFNPEWAPQMKKIRKLSPNSPAAARAMTQLLNQAVGKE